MWHTYPPLHFYSEMSSTSCGARMITNPKRQHGVIYNPEDREVVYHVQTFQRHDEMSHINSWFITAAFFPENVGV